MVKHIKWACFFVTVLTLLGCSNTPKYKLIKTDTPRVYYSDVVQKSKSKATFSVINVGDEDEDSDKVFNSISELSFNKDLTSKDVFFRYDYESKKTKKNKYNNLNILESSDSKFIDQMYIVSEQVFLFSPSSSIVHSSWFREWNQRYSCKFNQVVFGFIPEKNSDYLLSIGITIKTKKCIFSLNKIEKKTKKLIPVEFKVYGNMFDYKK